MECEIHTQTLIVKLLKQRKTDAQKAFFESLPSGFQGLTLNVTWLWLKIFVCTKIKVNVSSAEGQQLRKYSSVIVNAFCRARVGNLKKRILMKTCLNLAALVKSNPVINTNIDM